MEATVLSVDEELQNRIAELNAIQKKLILELIKSFAKKEDERMKPQTIEEYNQELKEAEEEYQRGDFITHEAMLNEVKKW